MTRSNTIPRAFEKDFAFLGLNILPNVLAPKGNRGRETVFQAFRKYYAQDGHKSGSRLIRARYEVNRKYGVSIEDIGRFDLSVCFGLLVNTVPATSWVLYYMYSQPSLLQEAREAISSFVHDLSDSSRGRTYRADVAEIVAGYPLLASLVQETLRVQSTNASARMVLKDTLLDDGYLLKKDSVLLIPSAELHASAAVWGPSFKDFDPRRFMQKSANRAKIQASAYRPYGGGASLCPGRYLAANEILITLVIMVLRYDLNPVRGRWFMPKSRPHITTSILTPAEDIEISITDRKGYEHANWKFEWNGSVSSPGSVRP